MGKSTKAEIHRRNVEDYYHKSPPYVTYCQIIPDAIVTDLGNIFITRDVKFVPGGCLGNERSDQRWNAFNLPLYDELLVITQRCGDTYFHRMIENVPRVVVFLDFLKRHPRIRIHAYEEDGSRLGELLCVIGLDPTDRFVTGWARAKV